MIDRTTRLLAAATAVLFAIAGPLHPDPATGVDDLDTAMHGQLESGMWVPSHLLLLASYACLTVLLVRVTRASAARTTARKIGLIAVAGAALTVVEMIFHLASVAEADALAADRATPLLDIHLAVAAFAYPVAGISLAALMIVLGFSGQLTSWWVAAIGAVGAVVHAIAPPLIVLSRDPDYSALFPLTTLMIVWLIAVAVPRRAQSTAALAGSA